MSIVSTGTGVVVFVTVNEVTLSPINVGSGKQSFKWLASVIQARLKEDSTLRSTYDKDGCIVNAMKNMKGELINPMDLILEHADEDKSVDIIAEICSDFPSDEWGNPVLGDWYFSAFVKSKDGFKWGSEIDAWRIKSSGDGDGDGGSERSSALGSSLVQIGETYSDIDIEAVFNLDWNQMHWDWLNFTLSEQQTTALKKSLKRSYSTICNLFAHYCGYGQVGERYGLTIKEFSHMLHMAGICNLNLNTSENKGISFSQNVFDHPMVKQNRPTTSSALQPLMTRVHFVQSIVSIVIIQDKNGALSELLGELLEGPFKDLWMRFHSHYLLYISTDPGLKAAVKEFYHLVKISFNSRYSGGDPRSGCALQYEEIKDMLVASSVLTLEQQAFLMQYFYSSQFNPKREAELEELVYAEFLEVVSRIAIQAIKSIALSDAKKIRLALHYISVLPHDITNSRK